MGVTYKLREEVVHFIISQRQSNPLASCRLLAESTSQKFGLHLSKSSVHDVLKGSGITTPRGRKPKYKFEIPQEKKKQIQVSLSQVDLLPYLPGDRQEASNDTAVILKALPDTLSEAEPLNNPLDPSVDNNESPAKSPSPEYEEAGRVFSKAVLWDLGIFSEENIKTKDWDYYLTYSKGIKVTLENDKTYFIDLPLPLERCIREATDGLINNVKPFIVHKVSDEGSFKSSMNAQEGPKIKSVEIVDEKDHILLELSDIMDINRSFSIENRVFVESNEINLKERLKAIFFPQVIENNNVIENILNLKGFDTTSKNENTVTLLIEDNDDNKAIVQQAAEKLNAMYLCDEQGRLVKVKIQPV